MVTRYMNGDFRLEEREITGECLEGIGIYSGTAVIDRGMSPVVGDVVWCDPWIDTVTGYLKQVIRLGDPLVVGTHYKDASRDFKFSAGYIYGVVIRMLDDRRRVIWRREDCIGSPELVRPWESYVKEIHKVPPGVRLLERA